MGLFKRKKPTPAEMDLETLRTLASHGADFSEVREVMHYVYSSDGEALKAASTSAVHAGWTANPSEASGMFGIEFAADKVINAEVVAEDRLLFENIAASVPDGDYDGWVASV